MFKYLFLIIFLFSCSKSPYSFYGGTDLKQKCSIKEEDNIYDICITPGTCSIKNMQLVYQLSNDIPKGDVACGPTAMHVLIDSLIKNTYLELSGWLEKYYAITPFKDPTGASSSVCTNNVSCRKVVSVANKIIEDDWSRYGKPVSTKEIGDFIKDIANNATINYQLSEDFPSTINECSFIEGPYALTNSQLWHHIFLYLKYPKIIVNKTSYQNTPMEEISFKNSTGGHYIALNGYNKDDGGFSFKFHCSVFGVRWYKINYLELNTPFCIESENGNCTYYIKLLDLPEGFTGLGASYIISYAGEERNTDYTFKFIGNVSGITE